MEAGEKRRLQAVADDDAVGVGGGKDGDVAAGGVDEPNFKGAVLEVERHLLLENAGGVAWGNNFEGDGRGVDERTRAPLGRVSDAYAGNGPSGAEFVTDLNMHPAERNRLAALLLIGERRLRLFLELLADEGVAVIRRR